MTTTFLPRYADAIRQFSSTTIEREAGRPSELLMSTGTARGKRIDIAYAPFDYVNPCAKVVIVGLTPGAQQMELALAEAGRCLRAGMDIADTIRRAKSFASFGGKMRPVLVEMLDFIGVNRLVNRPSSATLWSKDQELAHFTSCLRYPTFVDQKNYSGKPAILKTELLTAELESWLVEEMRALPEAVWITLGDDAAEAAPHAAKIAGLSTDRLILGLPHPSPNSRERSKYFVGRKPKDDLSPKTDGDKIDARRDQILRQMAQLIDERDAA